MSRLSHVGLLLCAWLSCASAFAADTLLRNGSFEATPCITPCNQAPWVMPSDWVPLLWFPSTYSNDGSYGLAPDAYGNFTGATAQDGLRWVAGWSKSPEVFGQVLTTPLIPGHNYVL